MSTVFNLRAPLVVVQGRVHGPAGAIRVRLAVDTGATWTIIGWRTLELAGYRPSATTERTRIVTGSGFELLPRLSISRVAALGHERENFAILGHSIPAAVRVDGLLGLDFFRGRRLTIDFRAGLIDLD